MKILKNTSGLAAVVTAAVAVAGLAPQTALAEKYSSKGSSVQGDLERRLQIMEDEMRALRAELARTRSESQANADKLEAHQQQVEQQLAETAEHEEEHHDLLFFRGGFAKMEHARNNELLLNNNVVRSVGGTSTFDDKDGEGWYVGAGFDHRLTDDLWGISDMASVDGEVMFEYKNFGSSHNTLVEAATGTVVTGNGLTSGVTTIENQLTQFTLTASPKIKFNGMGDFRPWVIPFGLAVHVISPPSSGVTVLNPGLMLGAGAEYKIWKDLYAGMDFRYHFTGGDLSYKARLPNGATLYNKTKIDGFTTGAYLGFGF
jgi:opacity protein-like surface antigen